MKNLKLIVLLFSLVVFISCGEDEPGPSGNSISANVSGDVSTNFKASGSIQGQQLVQGTLSEAGGSQVFSIVGTSTSGSAINMAITNYTGVGTYSLGLTSGNTSSLTFVNTSTFATQGFTAESGTIEVTSADGKITGTFSWDGVGNNGGNIENVAVSNGKFSVTPNDDVN